MQLSLHASDIIWGTAATASRVTAVDVRTLKTLANDGIIRARKIGNNRQSPTLYRISDICEWIESQTPAKFEKI